MGDAQSGVTTVSRLCALLIKLVCCLMRPYAREALLGDLAEANAGSAETLISLLGFLTRSQLQAWRTSRPWLVLMSIAVPAGLLLNSVVTQLVGSQSVYVWMYAHNWTNTYLHAGWLWSEMVPMLLGMISLWLRVALLCWMCGFVLVRIAKRTAWLQAMALILLIMNGQAIWHAVLPLPIFPFLSHGATQANAAAFSTNFYRFALPLTMKLLFAVAPALYGMYSARKASWFTSLYSV